MVGIAWYVKMAKYFFTPADKTGDTVILRGETAHHLLHVLRLRPGATVTLCDGARTDYTAVLQPAEATASRPAINCTFQITHQSRCTTEPPTPITVYQSLPKGDKFESIIQKSVELGAANIVPLYTAHTLAKNVEKKIARWQKIADSAAVQCNRGILPEVTPPQRFADALEKAIKNALSADEKSTNSNGTTDATTSAMAPALWLAALSPSEAGEETLPTLAQLFRMPNLPQNEPLPAAINIWIGPEGGFAREEVDRLLAAGAHAVSLGPRVLRTETAAPALLAQISLVWES